MTLAEARTPDADEMEISKAYLEAARLAREGWTEVKRLQAELEALKALLGGQRPIPA